VVAFSNGKPVSIFPENALLHARIPFPENAGGETKGLWPAAAMG
jgi:hypothetical protein